MLVPAGTVTGWGAVKDSGAAVLAGGVMLAGAAEAVIAIGFGKGELALAGAWGAEDAIWLGLEAGIPGGGGCAAPTGEEGGAT